MINRLLPTLILIISMPLSVAYGYVKSKTDFGVDIWWKQTNKNVYLHTDNSGSLDTDDVWSIIEQSVNQWTDNNLGFGVSIVSGQGTISNATNDIYFGDSSGYFGGGGVVAVTQTAYIEATGEIVEADIILNDSLYYSTSDADRLYLGNVVTHELGHFFGLSHSEVKNSSMFYTLVDEQWSVSEDDIAGALDMYQQGSKGKISGRVIGGDESAIGIFGAHVLAISAKDGNVVSALSDSDGSFAIGGLDLSNKYYLQVRPLTTVSVIPEYYSTVRNNFCYQGQSYSTHFFEQCESHFRGYPEAINITPDNMSVSVGDITIGCSLDSPAEYLSDKELEMDYTSGVNAFVGYVSSDTEESSIEIDLSDYVTNSSNEYLIINLLTQKLFSPVKLRLEVYKEGILLDSVDSGTEINLGIISRISLATYGTGVYELRVIVEDIVTSGEFYDGGNSFSDYFPEGTGYIDDYNYYFLTYDVGTQSGAEYLLNSFSNSASDNSSCFEGSNAYSIIANKDDLGDGQDDEKEPGFSCGTVSAINDSNGGPPGILSLIVGFLIVQIMRKSVVSVAVRVES